MELLQLRYFCKAAQLENISRAARYFGIPQPAMSKTIANLERELGMRLFERYGNRISLNERGRAYYEAVSGALASLRDGELALRDDGQALTGEISLLVLAHRRTVTDCIVACRQAHPEVSFLIRHDPEESATLSYDLVISSGVTVPRGMAHMPLLEEEIMLAVPRGHALAGRRRVALAELCGERMIAMPPGKDMHRIAVALCRAGGFEPRFAVTCDDPFFVRRYISAGLGIGFVPPLSWEGMFDTDTVLVHLQGGDCRRAISLFWHEDRYMSRAVQAFRAELAQRFQRLGARGGDTNSSVDV